MSCGGCEIIIWKCSVSSINWKRNRYQGSEKRIPLNGVLTGRLSAGSFCELASLRQRTEPAANLLKLLWNSIISDPWYLFLFQFIHQRHVIFKLRFLQTEGMPNIVYRIPKIEWKKPINQNLLLTFFLTCIIINT